ncbi:MAG TPA: hypothetical protein VGK54_06530, partial [Chloroflexota bacterium]
QSRAGLAPHQYARLLILDAEIFEAAPRRGVDQLSRAARAAAGRSPHSARDPGEKNLLTLVTEILEAAATRGR